MDQEAVSTQSDSSLTARVTRWVISLVILVLCAYMEWWLVQHGKPENILHQNAQFYGFVTIIGVMAGLGIGEAIGTVATAFKK